MCKKIILTILLINFLTVCNVSAFPNNLSKGKARDINDDLEVNPDGENPMPIIGILTQEVSNLILRKYPGQNYSSYIAASYVKFVEGAGGRVVPIWIGKERDYYEDIMSKINGVLLPGGATYFNNSDGYYDAGQHIYNIAIEMNNNGTYMPIWGTCLGYELLVYLSANGTDPRTGCSSQSQALPLEFKDGYQNSRLFKEASTEVINIFENYPVTANFHIYCFTQKTFADMNLLDDWNILSINHDWNGSEFISTVEHKKYPFYGVQFHPEKNLYEFVLNRNITHISKAITTSQYFADFFVMETRKNHNSFANKTEEANVLIYNYSPEYTGMVGSAFIQQYLFAERNAAGFGLHLSFSLILLNVLLFVRF
ncbi:gamma-glutamyl hydrolase A-like [Teleopsis dalmanni]|uniref:gamma-glutamyl hydrolase A-like n=1 Tax=Teleopsis dalmanni TaxID=139649 RepID=UPI0018CF2355|nr:gamma-glutamyl hydrolase A-like [Teleopsis dalmanni]